MLGTARNAIRSQIKAYEKDMEQQERGEYIGDHYRKKALQEAAHDAAPLQNVAYPSGGVINQHFEAANTACLSSR